MTVLEQCRIATQYYVRNKYYNYLKKYNLKFMTAAQIITFTNNTLDNNRDEVLNYIINEIKQMNKGKTLNVNQLKETINEIIDDRELLVNRICLEIENYQKSKFN